MNTNFDCLVFDGEFDLEDSIDLVGDPALLPCGEDTTEEAAEVSLVVLTELNFGGNFNVNGIGIVYLPPLFGEFEFEAIMCSLLAIGDFCCLFQSFLIKEVELMIDLISSSILGIEGNL